MESAKPTDENEESKRSLCCVAGGLGGLFSAFVTYLMAYIPEISWYIVHGWSVHVPWIVDSEFDSFRFVLGMILGVAFGATEKRRARFAFWMGAGMSFLVCYLIVPYPCRFRE
jgi:hypothetical protein